MKQLIVLLLALLASVNVMAEYPRPGQGLNGKYGYFSATGNPEIRPKFDNAMDFREGFAAVEMRGKWGFINLQGRFIAKCKYQEVRPFNYGYAVVKENNRWGVIDTEGKEVIPCIFDNMGELVDIKAAVEKYVPLVGTAALEQQQQQQQTQEK